MNSKSESKIDLLDCTIRDGSFSNAEQFTVRNVADAILKLVSAGIQWIELGHGYGLGAERIMTPLPGTLAEYIAAVPQAASKAKLGAFINPNIGTLDDIHRARDAGISFLRVGFIGLLSPLSIYNAAPLVEEAKKLGLWTSLNAIRTQTMTEGDIRVAANIASSTGADCFYIVDSTGGALPKQVRGAIAEIKSYFHGAIGFHGHNNLGLSLANSLTAVESGATFVDGTLKGIGRDAGNTSLELLAAVLQKAGFSLSANPYELLRSSELFRKPVFNVEDRDVHILLGEYDILTHGYSIMAELCDGDRDRIRRLAKAFSSASYEFEDSESLAELNKGLSL